MTLAKRLIPTANAKKNDDPVAEQSGTASASGSAMLTLRGPRKKRVFLSLVAICAVYLFIKYLPTDVPPISQRYDSRYGFLRPTAPTTPSSANDAQDAPPRPQGVGKERYFDGPVKFYYLTSSLSGAIVMNDNARNVLFGISNIKSASNVLPVACEMAKRHRNRVHVAVFGRQDITIKAVKDIYGTSDIDCPVAWHDARPDYAAYSSDQRMEISVRAALSHLLYYLKPSAVIVNDPGHEDHYFVGAVRDASGPAGVPVIILPDPAVERIGWLSELDSASLANWDKLQFEILVHASATSSASLIRLLKSIENADYTGTAYPHLTIELPGKPDTPTLDFLSNFQWPPGSSDADSKVTVRRRVCSKQLTPLEFSLRTVESFYPVHADRSHVLVLTSNAELSPSYFSYLKYLVLEYKYSTSAWASESAASLMGISLESPSELLNGSRFDLVEDARESSAPLVLWQAPSSHAALYFGDKWMEFHSFLSHRLATGTNASSSAAAGTDTISEDQPTWLAYLLELTRARAYYMLHPDVKTGSSPLVTIHTELHQSPIDLERTSTKDVVSSRPASPDLSGDEVLTGDEEQKKMSQPEPTISNTESILSLLMRAPDNPKLPQLQFLRHFSYEAKLVTPEISRELSISFADKFSLDFGGCKSLEDRLPASAYTADDLFCNEDDGFS